ncbi:SRPBCC family protein [Nocardiopsis sp. HUAS JQ3]|uniref:SRPBCC family protein n=1 Tax=Nocardiopsis sp. HUAS JQ3 TaxID=3061629 RepID=UPI0023A99312|nr:Clp protease N-terminal domain-containing protein [Nocardiopsis sp. HUAS JQ3]WDZ91870.1 Clp protease N-terminal domain-containing protein [Nocardiopsis sp. HUAS JQ3]
MTNPSAKQGLINRHFDRIATFGAASHEAARAGHAEVDFEHLLLGVLVTGGPGARLLMDSGVGLAEARSAIDEILREDLAMLGVDVTVPAPSVEDSKGWLRSTPRLEELEYDIPAAGGDASLLAALIDDEGGRVRRVLDRLGADTDRLRRDLGELAERPQGPKPSSADSADASEQPPEGWEYTTYDLEVPVSPERVWELVSDPERRGEWDPASVSSRQLGDGVVELTNRVTEDSTRESITHSVPGREVTWTQDDSGRTLRIVIEPLGDRSRLHLRRAWRNALKPRGIASRVVRWIAWQNLRGHAQTIAQAAAS